MKRVKKVKEGDREGEEGERKREIEGERDKKRAGISLMMDFKKNVTAGGLGVFKRQQIYSPG